MTAQELAAFQKWFTEEIEVHGPAWLRKSIYDTALAAWERRGQWDKENQCSP